MERMPLGLRYKGTRNYIQGGDIYNAVNLLAPSVTGSVNAFLKSISFHNFCRNDADLCLTPPDGDLPAFATAQIAQPENHSKKVWLVESSRKIVDRYPYDESRIEKLSNCTPPSVTLSAGSGYTPIEDAIAITKLLAYREYPSVTGKWVFGQLDLDQPLRTDYRQMRVDRKSSIAGKFTVNLIYQDDIYIGTIRFIVGQP